MDDDLRATLQAPPETMIREHGAEHLGAFMAESAASSAAVVRMVADENGSIDLSLLPTEVIADLVLIERWLAAAYTLTIVALAHVTGRTIDDVTADRPNHSEQLATRLAAELAQRNETP